ncbi:MAG: adenylosuccinate synthase [Bacteroidales bacterium]|nr:adenylosuccinate synthase [Bacteroidales bacterium]
MKTDVLLGLQWGDEGKGKIVDVLTPQYDIVARFQGGPNAGHTIEFEDKKFVLHTIPSGIFNERSTNIIGNGVLVDPFILDKELQRLDTTGMDVTQNLYVSRKAHLILPSHRLLDAVYEQAKGEKKIGSTLKGIGPAYTDKTSRNGIRVGDLETAYFDERYAEARKRHFQLASIYNKDFLEVKIEGLVFEQYEQLWLEKLQLLQSLKKIDSEYYLAEALKENKKILAEGAQGTMLDVDFGSYPFVTSSNTTSAGVCNGLGLAPSTIGRVFGIFKAYCTRVGSGPFPTELFDDSGKQLQEKGNEFGATTGRPRRCGWLDLPALKYAVMINGVTELMMMKADVLSGFKEIKVATHYLVNGKETEKVPYSCNQIEVEPVFKTFPGWEEDLSTIKSPEDLPDNFKTYFHFIEKEVGIPIKLISVGPDREQTLLIA